MSDDLISRKEITNHIESERRQWGEDYNVKLILNDIKIFPAFDNTEKIIGRLETYISQQSENEMLSDNGKRLVKRVIEECIKIVKSGGVED